MVSNKLVWLAFVAGKTVFWVALLYPLLFMLGPIVTAAIVRLSYTIRGIPVGGTPLPEKNDAKSSFISPSDAAEMRRRGIDPSLPLLCRVAAESVTYSSGLTAVLLQIAQTGVGKGVGRHSNFSTRLLERTQNTAIFIYVMVFGNDTERQLFRNFVTLAHKNVNDKRSKQTPTYDALDPDLQLWVAATMYVSMLSSYEKIFGALPEEQQEQIYQEFSTFGTALQVPLTLWPANRAAFQKYWDAMIASLVVPKEAYQTTRDLFQPKYNTLPLRLAILLFMTRPFNISVAAEELPEHVGVQFGLRRTWWTKAMYTAYGAFHKLVYPWYPAWVRQWQMSYYLCMMRERMAKKGMTRNGRHIPIDVLEA